MFSLMIDPSIVYVHYSRDRQYSHCTLFIPLLFRLYPLSLPPAGEAIDVTVEFIPTTVKSYDYTLSVDVLGASPHNIQLPWVLSYSY
jgi:hypothetical protein